MPIIILKVISVLTSAYKHLCKERLGSDSIIRLL